jgi:hypothetical protein
VWLGNVTTERPVLRSSGSPTASEPTPGGIA